MATHFHSEMQSLILKENSIHFNSQHYRYLQALGTAMGNKMAAALANIFVAKLENS